MSAVARSRSAAPVNVPRARLSSAVREIKDNGYIQMPWGFFKIAAKHLTFTQLLIICRVLEETKYKPRRAGAAAPEEWAVQETALARELGVTERTIRDVLEELGDGDDGPGVIQYRRSGRGIAVRVNLDRERLARLRCRSPRKLTRKVDEPDEVVEDDPAADVAETKAAKPVPARLECPVGLECPVTALVRIEGAWTNAPPGVESPPDSKRNSSSAFEASNGHPKRNSSSGLDGSNGHANGANGRPKRNSSSAFTDTAEQAKRNSSSAFEQLTNWSNSYAINRFGRILDNSLCAKILTELGPAPVLAFTSLVESRASKGGAIGFGLLTLIAHDARLTWEAGRALREQQLRVESSSSDAVVEDWRRKLRRPGLDPVELELIREACPDLADDVDGYRLRFRVSVRA